MLLLLWFFLFNSYSFFGSPTYECNPDVPCEYDDEVDFRVILLTLNRPGSLLKLLDFLRNVTMDGDSAALEIWIDRDVNGTYDRETVNVARNYSWPCGRTSVHILKKHVGIYGQWIDTWRPKSANTKELALILEDDLTVSPYVYRWTKAVHSFYKQRSDFAGSTLTTKSTTLSEKGKPRPLVGPSNQTAFMFKCVGTAGFSPKASVWIDFQNWYHAHIRQPHFRPYVPGIIPTRWYKKFEKDGTADSMWSMWFIYFANAEQLFTVYNNLFEIEKQSKPYLCVHRAEVGLHVSRKRKEQNVTLLNVWQDTYIRFKSNITKLDWDGNPVKDYC